jgi:ACS family tartrate transporter-like MFS transporter
MAWAGVAHDLGRSVAALSLATMAMYASLPLFWSVTTAGMSAKVAGPAIATVNCIGVMGGFAGPYAIGWLLEKTHSYAAGMGAIAACLVIGALIAVVPVSRVAPVSIG